MAANKIIRVQFALTTLTTTNILNPPVITASGVNGSGTFTINSYILIRKIAIGNKTNVAALVALWLGATGANAVGTEVPEFPGQASAGALTQGVSIPPNSVIERFFQPAKRLDVADFLVGGAGTATALVLEAECEIGLV
jgi:hypothetical protein